MSLSLKEQLLNAGFAKKNTAKPKKSPQVAKKNRHQPSEVQLRTQDAVREQAQKDKYLNAQRQTAAALKAKVSQIKQLVNTAKLDRSEGETPYSFNVGNKIKKIYVTEAQQKQLARGQIVIIAMDNGAFELVPKASAQKIAERDASYVVDNAAAATATAPDLNDPYAAYQIPDDLIW